MKYINADEFKKKLQKRYKAGIIGRNILICEFKAINDMPPADVVEVKHGEWKPCDVTSNNYEYCSICNWENDVGFRHYNFCPNCGADMRERKDDNE